LHTNRYTVNEQLASEWWVTLALPSPWKMLIGFPRTMLFANEKYAMSGRPQAPYTVKKRSPVMATLGTGQGS